MAGEARRSRAVALASSACVVRSAVAAAWSEVFFTGPSRSTTASRLSASLTSAALPRPEESFRPGFLVVARRHGRGKEPHLEPLPRWRGAGALVRDLVVGLGVPQVAELVLTHGARSLPGLAPTAASRLAAAGAFLARAQPLRLDLARDAGLNARFLLDALAGVEGNA